MIAPVKSRSLLMSIAGSFSDPTITGNSSITASSNQTTAAALTAVGGLLLKSDAVTNFINKILPG